MDSENDVEQPEITPASSESRTSSVSVPLAGEALSTLPSGTITFLFTDIEGSTWSWDRDPEAMQHAFARQEAIVRERKPLLISFQFISFRSRQCHAERHGTDVARLPRPEGNIRIGLICPYSPMTAMNTGNYRTIARNSSKRC
jgi:hypothetical protein